MQPGLIVLMLSLLLGLQPITTDLYLPALPALTAGFGASIAWFSWRIALLAVAIFGAIFLAVMGLRFRETLAHKNLAALQPATVVRTWTLILKHPTFLAFSLLSATSIGPFPQSAGVASAMNGFFMMVLGIWFWSVLVALTAWTLVQKYGAIDGH